MATIKQIKRLVRLDFDNLENHNPLSEHLVACFADDTNKTVHAALAEFLGMMPAVRLYAGYDGEIYPKFVVRTETLWQNPAG